MATTRAKAPKHQYTALSPTQVRETYMDALRMVEHAHLQDSVQLEVAKLGDEPNKGLVDNLEGRVNGHLAEMTYLRDAIDAMSSAD